MSCGIIKLIPRGVVVAQRKILQSGCSAVEKESLAAAILNGFRVLPRSQRGESEKRRASAATGNVTDVDIATPAKRGFFCIEQRTL